MTLLLGTLVLSGCSALRLGYNNAAQFSWWWLDGYFDFSREQAPLVKRTIDQWFDWHRSTQLADYAALLASARQQVLAPTTGAAACSWQDRVRQKLEPALQRAISDFADVVPSLGETQLRHLEQRYVVKNADMRDDFLQPDPAVRQRESVERAVERAERVYGRLDEAQLRLVTAGIAASSFNPELWLAERQRRQRDTLQTLRKLLAERADKPRRVAELQGLVRRYEQSANAEYRAYQLRLADYNCTLAAQIHNATTPAQRRTASERLQGWEADLRALVERNDSAAPVPGLPGG